MGEFLAVMSMLIFASNTILIKFATARLNVSLGFLINVMVNIVFAALLLLIQILYTGGITEFHPRAFILFLITGFFATYLGRWFNMETVKRMGPARSSTFQTSNPLFTVLISWIVLGEMLSIPQWFAVVIVLAGLFLVSYVKAAPTASSAQHSDHFGHTLRRQMVGTMVNVRRTVFNPDFLFAFFSALAYALGNILRGVAVQEWNEPILGALLGAFCGFLLHLLFNVKLGTIAEQFRQADRLGMLLYSVSGMFNISAQILLIAAMHYIPVSLTTIITQATPIIVLPVSYFILKNQENLSMKTVIGAVMVLSGISIVLLM